QHLHLDYHLISYQEHALEMGTGARAAAYVAIQSSEGRIVWGAGTHADIMAASVNALVSAINRMGAMKGSAR
ncbi:MAG: alpha-isopropylmalate synthase regulatory domain-containing protein, partial [Clostridia bacterium]